MNLKESVKKLITPNILREYKSPEDVPASFADLSPVGKVREVVWFVVDNSRNIVLFLPHFLETREAEIKRQQKMNERVNRVLMKQNPDSMHTNNDLPQNHI